MQRKEKLLYITTPVFYPNDKPHLGHAFTAVLADSLKRYHTSLGFKCWFGTGTDEHGEKIFRAAENANLPIEEFLDGTVSKFKELWVKLGIKYDKYTRTTDYAHKYLVKKVFEEFSNNNLIYWDNWQGWYCASCEEGYSFRSIEKTAECKLGHPLILKNEETYFLKVRAFKAWIHKEFYEREDWIYPKHYKKEMINNFINDLDDLSITRSTVSWGVKVPDNDDQVIYVWFDALLSYLSALNFGNYGKTGTKTFKNFWDNPNCKIIHVIGKEICRFHSIYWPIMLQNLGIRLFDNLIVHGWLLFNNEKMSKSKQNIIDPAEMLETVSRDCLRFYLMKFNYYLDNQTNKEDIITTYNSHLANTYGNLISRFYGIMSKKFDLTLPKSINLEEYLEVDQLDIQITSFLENDYEKNVIGCSTYVIVDKIFDLFRSAGKLIEKNKAWELEATDGLLQAIVVTIYRLLCIGTWALSPILVDAAPEIFEVLDVPLKKRSFEGLKQRKLFLKRTIKPLDKVFFPRIKDISTE